MTKPKVTRPIISFRNPDWNDYVPTVGDRVIVTRVADRSLRHILGERATVHEIDNEAHEDVAKIRLITDRELLGKKIHSVWDDEVLMQKENHND
jgi:hypothetical protein